MQILNTIPSEDGALYDTFFGILNKNRIIFNKNVFNYKLYQSDIMNNTVQFKQDTNHTYNPSQVLDYNRYNGYFYNMDSDDKDIYSTSNIYELTSYHKKLQSMNLDFKGINNDNLHDSNELILYDNKLRIYPTNSYYSEDTLIKEYSNSDSTKSDIDFERFQSLTIIHSKNNNSESAIGSYFVYLTSNDINVIVWDGTNFIDNILTFDEPINDSQPYLQRLHTKINSSSIDDINYCNDALFVFACTGLKDETYFVKIKIDNTDGLVELSVLQNTQEINKIERDNYTVVRDSDDGSILRTTHGYLNSLSIAEELLNAPNLNEFNNSVFMNSQIDYDTFIFQRRRYGVYEERADLHDEHDTLYLYTSIISYIDKILQLTPVFIQIDLSFPSGIPPFKVWGFSEGGRTSNITYSTFTPKLPMIPDLIQHASNIIQNTVNITDDLFNHTIPDILNPHAPGNVRTRISQFHQLSLVDHVMNDDTDLKKVNTIQIIITQSVIENKIIPLDYVEIQIPYSDIITEMTNLPNNYDLFHNSTINDFQYKYIDNSPNIFIKQIQSSEFDNDYIEFIKIIENKLVITDSISFSNRSNYKEHILFDPTLYTIMRTYNSTHAPKWAGNILLTTYSLNDNNNYSLHIRNSMISDDHLYLDLDITALYLSKNINCYMNIVIPDNVNLVLLSNEGTTNYVKELLVYLDRSVYTSLRFKAQNDIEINDEILNSIYNIEFNMINHSVGTTHLENNK